MCIMYYGYRSYANRKYTCIYARVHGQLCPCGCVCVCVCACLYVARMCFFFPYYFEGLWTACVRCGRVGFILMYMIAGFIRVKPLSEMWTHTNYVNAF